MFKPASHPVFPHLIHLKDVKFKSWGSESKEKATRLYRLDWESLDLYKQQRHSEWNQNNWPDKIVSISFKLDHYYEDLLQSLRFAIPHHYLDEIHDQTQKAVEEWNRERHFDTNIREACLAPTFAHARVAFELLCDCAYDEQTNYYLRVDNKYILIHLLLYRFWMGQTGRGCVQRHADFPELKERLTRLENTGDALYESAALRKFLDAIDRYENDLNASYSKIQCIDTPITKEKSKGKSKNEATVEPRTGGPGRDPKKLL